MNEDYLWDKSGEPDTRVQELERILGTLKYQPRPLEIPARLQTGAQRFFFPSFAIAAAITLVALGVGLWLGIHRGERTSSGVEAVNLPSSIPAPSTSPSGAEGQLASDRRGDEPKLEKSKHASFSRHWSGTSKHANNALVAAKRASEREEAAAAKAQLMIALRVASSKLSLAQKKTQGAYPASLIRNQHKAG
jgi:hypothetical protein